MQTPFFLGPAATGSSHECFLGLSLDMRGPMQTALSSSAATHEVAAAATTTAATAVCGHESLLLLLLLLLLLQQLSRDMCTYGDR